MASPTDELAELRDKFLDRQGKQEDRVAAMVPTECLSWIGAFEVGRLAAFTEAHALIDDVLGRVGAEDGRSKLACVGGK